MRAIIDDQINRNKSSRISLTSGLLTAYLCGNGQRRFDLKESLSSSDSKKLLEISRFGRQQ